MLSAPAWCNLNQILPHYPQNGEGLQQPLLPVILNQNTDTTVDTQGGPRGLPVNSCHWFCAGKTKCTAFPLNSLQTKQPLDRRSWFPIATIMSCWFQRHLRFHFHDFPLGHHITDGPRQMSF